DDARPRAASAVLHCSLRRRARALAALRGAVHVARRRDAPEARRRVPAARRVGREPHLHARPLPVAQDGLDGALQPGAVGRGAAEPRLLVARRPAEQRLAHAAGRGARAAHRRRAPPPGGALGVVDAVLRAARGRRQVVAAQRHRRPRRRLRELPVEGDGGARQDGPVEVRAAPPRLRRRRRVRRRRRSADPRAAPRPVPRPAHLRGARGEQARPRPDAPRGGRARVARGLLRVGHGHLGPLLREPPRGARRGVSERVDEGDPHPVHRRVHRVDGRAAAHAAGGGVHQRQARLGVAARQGRGRGHGRRVRAHGGHLLQRLPGHARQVREAAQDAHVPRRGGVRRRRRGHQQRQVQDQRQGRRRHALDLRHLRRGAPAARRGRGVATTRLLRVREPGKRLRDGLLRPGPPHAAHPQDGLGREGARRARRERRRRRRRRGGRQGARRVHAAVHDEDRRRRAQVGGAGRRRRRVAARLARPGARGAARRRRHRLRPRGGRLHLLRAPLHEGRRGAAHRGLRERQDPDGVARAPPAAQHRDPRRLDARTAASFFVAPPVPQGDGGLRGPGREALGRGPRHAGRHDGAPHGQVPQRHRHARRPRLPGQGLPLHGPGLRREDAEQDGADDPPGRAVARARRIDPGVAAARQHGLARRAEQRLREDERPHRARGRRRGAGPVADARAPHRHPAPRLGADRGAPAEQLFGRGVAEPDGGRRGLRLHAAPRRRGGRLRAVRRVPHRGGRGRRRERPADARDAAAQGGQGRREPRGQVPRGARRVRRRARRSAGHGLRRLPRPRPPPVAPAFAAPRGAGGRAGSGRAAAAHGRHGPRGAGAGPRLRRAARGPRRARGARGLRADVGERQVRRRGLLPRRAGAAAGAHARHGAPGAHAAHAADAADAARGAHAAHGARGSHGARGADGADAAGRSHGARVLRRAAAVAARRARRAARRAAAAPGRHGARAGPAGLRSAAAVAERAAAGVRALHAVLAGRERRRRGAAPAPGGAPRAPAGGAAELRAPARRARRAGPARGPRAAAAAAGRRRAAAADAGRAGRAARRRRALQLLLQARRRHRPPLRRRLPLLGQRPQPQGQVRPHDARLQRPRAAADLRRAAAAAAGLLTRRRPLHTHTHTALVVVLYSS
ncbi:hypothetical protein AURANDRAFT_71829, partial [Aureococcus anophagefferens]